MDERISMYIKFFLAIMALFLVLFGGVFVVATIEEWYHRIVKSLKKKKQHDSHQDEPKNPRG